MSEASMRRHRHRRKGWSGLALVLMLASCLSVSWGADVRRLSVTYGEGEFVVSAELGLRASREGIFRVLTDYARWHELNSNILESSIVSTDRDGRRLIHSLTRACLLFLCRGIAQIQAVTAVKDREIIAVTLPGDGGLRRGKVRWLLEAEDGHTRVDLSARLQPDFWIPPVIGPWSIKTALRQEVLETAGNLERLASPTARVR